MTGIDTGNPVGTPNIDGRANRPSQRPVSFLDQALWKQFTEAVTPEAYIDAWLALQCRLISNVGRGVVVLGEADEGPFAPAAFWPEEGVASAGLATVADMALSERRAIIQNVADDQPGVAKREAALVAYPFIVEGQLLGAIALEMADRAQVPIRDVIRQLQWGSSWIELFLYKQRSKDEKNQSERTATTLDLIATSLEHEGFQAACNAAATELALKLGCDQVCIGFISRGQCSVVAMSNSGDVGARMNLVRDQASAMDEAIDQGCMVLYPPDPKSLYYVTRAHERLVRDHDAGTILTVPMGTGTDLFGAISFQRNSDNGFDQPTVELCDTVTEVIGPLLKEKRANDRLVIWKLLESVWLQLKRLFGPKYLGRKLAIITAALVIAVFAVLEGDYRLTSPARLEGVIQRSIVAPFDGYIALQSARAGDIVQKGQVVATLDDKDLGLERLRWSTTRRQRLTEYSRALAKRERAETKIIKTQIEQAEAQIALLDEQIVRTKLTMPFDGVLVLGDLSQSVGAAVQRGQELFKVAPLHSYRIILEVDESDITQVRVGQTGSLLVSSLSDEVLSYKVSKITPVSEAREGRNYFRVEATLDDTPPSLRPGMEGVAKTTVDQRLLIWSWTHKMFEWVRLTIWAWWP